MLGAFIRLVDSLFVEALIAQVVACTKGLLSLLAGQKGSEKVRWAPLARCSAASSLCDIAQDIAQHLDLQLRLQSLQMTPPPLPPCPPPPGAAGEGRALHSHQLLPRRLPVPA